MIKNMKKILFVTFGFGILMFSSCKSTSNTSSDASQTQETSTEESKDDGPTISYVDDVYTEHYAPVLSVKEGEIYFIMDLDKLKFWAGNQGLRVFENNGRHLYYKYVIVDKSGKEEVVYYEGHAGKNIVKFTTPLANVDEVQVSEIKLTTYLTATGGP